MVEVMHQIKKNLYKQAEMEEDVRLFMRGANEAYRELLKNLMQLKAKYPEYSIERAIELLKELTNA